MFASFRGLIDLIRPSFRLLLGSLAIAVLREPNIEQTRKLERGAGYDKMAHRKRVTISIPVRSTLKQAITPFACKPSHGSNGLFYSN